MPASEQFEFGGSRQEAQLPCLQKTIRVVKVSARIITWPDCCACCCRPADQHMILSHSRAKGVRVVRTTTGSWNVPYCTSCLEHVRLNPIVAATSNELAQARAEHEANIGYRQGKIASFDRRIVQSELRVGKIERRRIAFLITGIVLTVGLSTACSITAKALATRLLMIVLGILASPGGAALGGFLWRAVLNRAKRSHLRLLRSLDVEKAILNDDLDTSRENLNQALAAYKRLRSQYAQFWCGECASRDLAVTYEGWSGSVEEFHFQNDEFANLFVAANEKKVVQNNRATIEVPAEHSAAID